MKKTKVYRPRRGMRFSNGRRGVSPPAGFIGSGPIVRTRATSHDDSDALTVMASGAVFGSVGSPSNQAYEPFSPVIASSSLALEGAVSIGRRYEKAKLNAVILGSSRSAVGVPPFPSVSVVDSGPTGSFESPSWTHSSIGSNQGFVGTPLSTGSFEVNSLNYFQSGTETLVSSPTITKPLVFSKEQRLQTIVVKKTASVGDTTIQVTGSTPVTFTAGTGTLCSTVTGSGLLGSGGNPAPYTASTNNPATFFINVPVSGRLVDIKVWIELAHQSASTGLLDPLALLGVAIKNPNLSWGHAHPIYNDPLFKKQALSDHFSASIPNFYRDTFLLWEGAALSPVGGDQRQITNGAIYPFPNDAGASDPATGGFNRQKYPCWNLDRGMRTVFSDGSPVPNPRHLYSSTSPSGNFVGAPNAFFGINSAYGNDVPWTSDVTIVPFTGSRQAAGSPPRGWLNGAGGKADVNEWPTTGSNYGTNTLRPVYPLLDPIFIRKVIGTETTFMSSSVYPDPPTPDLWRGFRPGLRGSEISGTWSLFIVNNFNAGSFGADDVMPLYFRQVRLEITYESQPSARPFPIRRSYLSGAPIPGSQPLFLYAMSGTARSNFGTLSGSNPDYFRTLVFTSSSDAGEVGRTFGILLNSGSMVKVGLDPSKNDYALMYRLSGALGDLVGPTPSWLLSNQAGMPAIPESSASLVPFVSQPVSSVSFNSFFLPRRELDSTQRLQSVASDLNPPLRLRDMAAAFVSASTGG